MSIITKAGLKGTMAVRKLREQKLKNGLPFMINAEELDTRHCYIEYPDGSIKLVKMVHTKRDMDVVRELNATEARQLRHRFHFSSIH